MKKTSKPQKLSTLSSYHSGKFARRVAEVEEQIGQVGKSQYPHYDRLPMDSGGLPPECEALRQAYLDAGVLGAASADDARHIAIATSVQVDLVVSWNFKHIVHFDKIAGFEEVNEQRNYRSPRIYSPQEVVES